MLMPDMLQGQKLCESSKPRIPEGIKSSAQNFKWQTSQAFFRGRKQEAHAKNPANRSQMTSSADGFYSRMFVQMYQVRIRFVFRTANSDDGGSCFLL
jgi:hypothetical protein